MVPDNKKWELIVQFLEGKGVSGRDKNACTIRWGGMLKIWRLVRDFVNNSIGNQDYWSMDIAERSVLSLLVISKDLYTDMDFLCERACNQPKATLSSMRVQDTPSEVPYLQMTILVVHPVRQSHLFNRY